jgi:hypothetical protein
MIDLSPHRTNLAERIAVIDSLMNETHPNPPQTGAISREARGLAIVLLYAAYEQLLTSLTRTLLEAAIGLRVSNRRLKPGFRVFALHSAAMSAREVSSRKLFTKALPELVRTASLGDRTSTIDAGIFPSDGSFMKRTQVELWTRLFEVGNPQALLPKVWNNLDGVVSQRNGIAHGRLTPQEVGRNYTEDELRELVQDWAKDWDGFLLHVQSLASTRDFFRSPR